jgi:hypothetical protein
VFSSPSHITRDLEDLNLEINPLVSSSSHVYISKTSSSSQKLLMASISYLDANKS